MNCSGQALTSITNLPTNRYTYDLRGNPELHTNINIFENLTLASTLFLPYASLNYKNSDLFAVNQQLQKLCFPDTFVEVGGFLFNNTLKLKSIMGLRVERIPSGVFQSLEKLQHLHLETAENSLDSNMFVSNSALERVSIIGDNILVLPASLLNTAYKSLKSLRLKMLKIASLPTGFLVAMTSLKELIIEAPKLTVPCQILPPLAYRLSVSIEAAYRVNACVFENTNSMEKAVISNVQHVGCGPALDQAGGMMGELVITNSNLTHLSGKLSAVYSRYCG